MCKPHVSWFPPPLPVSSPASSSVLWQHKTSRAYLTHGPLSSLCKGCFTTTYPGPFRYLSPAHTYWGQCLQKSFLDFLHLPLPAWIWCRCLFVLLSACLCDYTFHIMLYSSVFMLVSPLMSYGKDEVLFIFILLVLLFCL